MTEQKKGKPDRKTIAAIAIIAIIPALIILYNRYDNLMRHQETQMNNQPALANHQKAKRNRLANPKKRQTQQSTLSTDENAFPPQPPTSPDDIGNATNPQEPQTLSAQPPNNESTGNPTPRAMTKAGEAEATRIAKKATTSKEYFTQNPTPIDRLHRAINAPDESPKKPNNPVIWFDTDHKNQGNYE